MRFLSHCLVFLWREPGEHGDVGSLSGSCCAMFVAIVAGGAMGGSCSGELQGIVGGCSSAYSARSVALAWFVQNSFMDMWPGGVWEARVAGCEHDPPSSGFFVALPVFRSVCVWIVPWWQCPVSVFVPGARAGAA